MLSVPKRIAAASCSILFVLCSEVRAQEVTETYVLEDVWLLPSSSHPGYPARRLTGTFEWTYDPAEPENGTGTFLELTLPWYGSSFNTLTLIVEPKSMEFVLPGNFHGLGVDVSLFLDPELTSCQVSPIDLTRSSFTIEVGVAYSGVVISGSAVPDCSTSAGPLESGPPALPGAGPPAVHNLPFVLGAPGAGTTELGPVLVGTGGAPRIGNRDFQLVAKGLPDGAACLLLGSVSRDPALRLERWFVAAGQARIPFSIPNDERLVGAELDLRLMVLDRPGPAEAASGLTLTVLPAE